jgi:phage head maturation protease
VCGRWLSLFTTERGIYGVGYLEDEDVAEVVLQAAFDGELRGFSSHARVLDADEQPERDGVPCRHVTQAELVSAGPVDRPADLGCRIERAGGVELVDRAALETVRGWLREFDITSARHDRG